MRRRSTTINAETVEEYLELAKEEMKPKIKPDRARKGSGLSRKNRENRVVRSCLDTLLEVSEDEEDLDMDLFYRDEEPRSQELKRSPSALGILCPISDSISSIENELTKAEERSIKKIMMIGMPETGRYSLISNLFEEESKPYKKEENTDVFIKKRKYGSEERSYKFWIRDPTNKNLDPLIKLYFENISTYLFVYSITNRNSFEVISSSIQEVLNQVGKENFIGVLIGTYCDQEDQRKITYQEGLKLSQKYHLEHFFETNHADDTIRQKLFSILDKNELF